MFPCRSGPYGWTVRFRGAVGVDKRRGIPRDVHRAVETTHRVVRLPIHSGIAVRSVRFPEGILQLALPVGGFLPTGHCIGGITMM